MRQFCAMVRNGLATMCVTVRAGSEEKAREKLISLGYTQVLWVI